MEITKDTQLGIRDFITGNIIIKSIETWAVSLWYDLDLWIMDLQHKQSEGSLEIDGDKIILSSRLI